MKRIFFIAAFILASAAAAPAGVLLEGFGSYTMAGDMENEMGPGFGIGYTVTENVNVLARGIFNSARLHADSPQQEDYSYRMFMGAVEYAYAFKDTPLVWISGAGLGASSTRVEFRLSGVESMEENGITLAGWTGLAVVATQHVSPFIQAGYHKSFYSADFKDATVAGFQFFAGVRILVFGRSRSIDSEY